ncbi:hypothetical protein Rcae01_00840 [Novipirellula caenicola]|uniref:Uncharacterized protein n=1 Tax=Novipirellula caenicola TaxID=1536901 RepID=A0ABP9VJL8_9BACT
MTRCCTITNGKFARYASGGMNCKTNAGHAASCDNEVIIAGCGGDKRVLGLLSLVGPSAPSVTHGVLSTVRGNVIAGWRLTSMRGLDS